ncbi:hypothetical protein ATJ97_1418 [Georgenia soli]|uniref:ESAT-6 protein secretion system EspG family protein n=1 Tax=Georgenia soli TaxID=638953 RepID=A0A2A9EJY8_9MICO|nr:hypothetical protein [Georgenia soli]PFG38926.1 hypothetical protein ATJ97_1418 [Georgenia soli]
MGVRALRLHDITGPLLLSVDLASWHVLLGALDQGPALAVPSAFTPDPAASLSPAERAAAWERLAAQGLAVTVPPDGAGTPADLLPAVVTGLALFGRPGVRARVSSLHGSTAVTEVAAWDGTRAVALARRRRTADMDADGPVLGERAVEAPAVGAPAVDEPAVELAFLRSEDLLAHLLRAVPPAPPGERYWPGAPVTVPWPRSVAMVQALRDDRPDVAHHLADLPEEAFVALGAVARRLTGAVDLAVLGTEHRTPPYRSSWLWTAEEIVRLTEATPEAVGLQLSGRRTLRAELLGALAGLAREQAGRTADIE